ncbi:MAG: hypothetical protein ACOC0U_01665 [Desulfovibrionales bacterium]
MPTVECSECKRRYTDTGEPCPFCGYPNSPEGAQPAKPVQAPEPTVRTNIKYGYVGILVALIVIALIWWFFS